VATTTTTTTTTTIIFFFPIPPTTPATSKNVSRIDNGTIHDSSLAVSRTVSLAVSLPSLTASSPTVRYSPQPTRPTLITNTTTTGTIVPTTTAAAATIVGLEGLQLFQ
jgi:hypothetical protein